MTDENSEQPFDDKLQDMEKHVEQLQEDLEFQQRIAQQQCVASFRYLAETCLDSA